MLGFLATTPRSRTPPCRKASASAAAEIIRQILPVKFLLHAAPASFLVAPRRSDSSPSSLFYSVLRSGFSYFLLLFSFLPLPLSLLRLLVCRLGSLLHGIFWWIFSSSFDCGFSPSRWTRRLWPLIFLSLAVSSPVSPGSALGDPPGLSEFHDLANLVSTQGACALPGVNIKYDSFTDAMWRAVAGGFVKREHAVFVADGLRHGFKVGFDQTRMSGHRWFRNYPSATDASARIPLHDAIAKRLLGKKSLSLGAWSSSLGSLVRSSFSATAIFPMGCVDKAIEFVDGLPSVKAKRPTSDHTRTGFNAACELVGLLFSLNAYDEIAWFLRQGHFMRVSDVEGAYTLLPFHPSCWPFMFFRYFESPTSDAEHLYVNVCGDFGTAGLPGVFKIFFVDVVVKMARFFQVLTLPMVVYVDDTGLIGANRDAVDREMLAFHEWAGRICGVFFKAIKDRLAASTQLMLGLWWNSDSLTRTLEDVKLASYLRLLFDYSSRKVLTLREMQSAAGKMQRACMTLPPGAACLVVSLFTLMAGLRLPWHRRRTTKRVRGDFEWLHFLLELNMGVGYYAYSLFKWGAGVRSDASASKTFSGGGYVSQCGMYNFWRYGRNAARKGIDFLEGDTVVVAVNEMGASWYKKLIPFGIDNMVFERSLAKGRCKVERINVLIRELFALQIRHTCVIQTYWLPSKVNIESDHLSRNRELEFLQSVYVTGFWSSETVPVRHGNAGSIRTLPENRGLPPCTAGLDSFASPLPDSLSAHPSSLRLGKGFSERVEGDGSRSVAKSLLAWAIFLLFLPSARAAGPSVRFSSTVPYERATLFEGLDVARTLRLEQILDNRFKPGTWKKIRRGVALWKEFCASENWSPILATGSSVRGSRMVAWVLHLVDDTSLVYKSIETYVWGMRTWMTLQHQQDPVLGVMGYDTFMLGIKVLTFAVGEPRRAINLRFVEWLIDQAELTDDFGTVQLVLLLLFLLYSFSRSETPLPKNLTGPEGPDPGQHWQVQDVDVATVEGVGKPGVWVRFKGTKVDPRQERPEARGTGDWVLMGSIAGSKWCPLKWLMRHVSLLGPRPPAAYLFVHSLRRPDLPLTYGSAMDHLHRAQSDFGIPDGEHAGLHGGRVEAYNAVKRSLGEEVAVVQGNWRRTSHLRYHRSRMAEIFSIPAHVASSFLPGADGSDGESGDEFGDGSDGDDSDRGDGGPSERPAQRPVRLRRGDSGAANVDDDDDDAGARSLLPPGWHRMLRVPSSGRQYAFFEGPDGLKAYSRPEAWRVHTEARRDAFDDFDEDEPLTIDEAPGQPSPGDVVRATPASAGTPFFRESPHGRVLQSGTPPGVVPLRVGDLSDHVVYSDRPSARRPPVRTNHL